MRDPGSQRVREELRGWYILEASFIIFGVAALVLGAADIARIFHARSAVRQGVTDGLRCLYPTAESCSTTIPGSASFNFPLFRSFVQTTGGFEYPRSNYQLSSGWFDEPIFEARKIKRSLESIDVLYGRSAYRRYDVKFPVDAHAMYLVQTRDMPTVELHPDTRLSPQLRVVRARFRDRATGGEFPGEPPGHKVISLSSVQGSTTSSSRQEIGRVAFDLGDAWPTRESDRARIAAFRDLSGFQGRIPCYSGAWKQGQNGPVLVWPNATEPAACRYQNQTGDLFEGGDLLVPLMLRISGDRYATSRTAKGVISADIEYTRNGALQRYSLGGRVFESNTTNASLVIRGVGQGFDADDAYFDVCKNQANYTECERYASLPLVPQGSRVTVKFYLERTEGPGSVGWAGDWLQIFYPQFGLGQEKRECGRSNAPHVCAKSVEPMRPLLTLTDISGGITSEQVPGSGHTCHRTPPSASYPSKEVAVKELQHEFESGERSLSIAQFAAGSSELDASCSAVPRSGVSCTDAGVTDYRGCQKPIEYPVEQLLSKCGVLDFDRARDKVSNVTFKDVSLPETEMRAACTGQPFPGCAQSYLSGVGRQFYTDAPSTTCQHALAEIGPTQSYGPIYDLKEGPGCPNIIEELKVEYRKGHPQVPPQVQIDAAATELLPEGAAAPPSSRCQKYTVGASREDECATGVALHVAEQCCAERGGVCRIESVSADNSAGSASVWQGRIALARARAEETVRIAYPRVQSVGSAPCSATAKRCLQIQGATLDNESRVQLTASLQVPLALLGWLGLQDMSTVQYSETRTLETALMGTPGL
jgi:hypothetical protein